tara:strand:+ start:24 stop:587 length:564 start_codon:yes stop_codon:yes gene_type:complete
MSEIKLIFVRHGEAESAYGEHNDPALSIKGISQSKNLLKNSKLQNLEKFTFISSPKLRAFKTAEPLAKKFNKKILVDDNFIEIPAEDIPLNKKPSWLKGIVETKKTSLPESIELWRSSILQRTRDIQNDSIIFTHFMVMNALMSELIQAEKLLCFYPDYTSIIEINVKNKKIKSFSNESNKKTYINL